MAKLSREVRRLIVEAAMAAPSYGLISQAKGLLSAFRVLDLDPEIAAITRGITYFGLHRPRAALAAIKNLNNEKARTLRKVIAVYLDEAKRKQRAPS